MPPAGASGDLLARAAFAAVLRVGHRPELVDLARAVLVERVRGGVGVIDRILPAGRAVVHDHAAGDVAGGLHHLLRRRLRLALRRVREIAHVLRHLRLGRRVRHAARRRCEAIDHLRVGGEAVHVVQRLVAARAPTDGGHLPAAAALGMHRRAEQDRARRGGLAELSAPRGQRKAQCTQFGLGLLVVARLQRVGGVLEVLLRVLQLLVIDRAARDIEALHAAVQRLHLRHIDRLSRLGRRRRLLGGGAARTLRLVQRHALLARRGRG